MRGKGISYGTGFVRSGVNSQPRFDPAVVGRELRIIRNDLHCTAVRVLGGDPERLEVAATLAAGLGLEVWFSPYPLESTPEEMLALFADCAERAERLRRGGATVVFVTGAEMSIMNHGFLPGESMEERLALFGRPEALRAAVPHIGGRVNAFLARAVAVVRERFGGEVTYASVPLDAVDWAPFDIVSVDLYWSAAIADQFVDGVRRLVAGDKRAAVTEFGSATYRGAADRGALGLDVLVRDGTGNPVRLDGAYDRDEAGQADYLRRTLRVFDDEGVDSAFVFIFALDFPHRPDGAPEDDLDLASYGIVKPYDDRFGTTYPGLRWEPKLAFTAVADAYRA
jgi:hypothetical protein